MAGQEWNAIKIDEDLQQVKVEKNTTGIATKWKGISYFDIPFELAQEVGRLLSSNNSLPFLDADAQSILRMQRDIYNALHWQQGKWVWDIADEENIVYLWTFSGEKINRVIEILLSSKLDAEINCDYRQVRIDFKKIKPRPIDELQELLSSFKTINREDLIWLFKGIARFQVFFHSIHIVADDSGTEFMCAPHHPDIGCRIPLSGQLS